ncbi:protein mono-ADP-ribosyltransferase PARP4-like [Ochotona curzoniae]|uniref:protein mono-ADP-ribosyltransferase PARP4-like n=1 Tax=Ochotona curzoniae TaxID=130825 RepID=UPI001B349629|nr:protein mono-ADP-ribosyltransferase PARP4-like [Ochotona curzoniae]
MTLGIFSNCTFCLKVKYLPRQQKRKLQFDIKENGGKFSLVLNPQCTHVVLDNADFLSQYQLDSIRKKRVHIASPEFIWDCIKERRLLDVKNYEPTEALAVTLPPDQNTRSSEVETDDLSLDDVMKQEDTVEPTEFHVENVEISHFPQDFEVAKYNTLEKVGINGDPEVVVVELCCSQAPEDPPFLICAHFLLADGVQTRRQFAVKKTAADASEYYANYIEELKKQGFLLREHFTLQATQLASEKLQALLLEEVMGAGPLSPEVSDLVELLWTEVLGHLEHTLLKPVNSISLNDVSKAEGILLLAKSALKNGETAQHLRKVVAEFYRLIPHKAPGPEEVNLKLLAKEEDLCQLIRDMVNVCETNFSKPNPPSLAKYRALRCKIEHVEQNTEEFLSIKKEILKNNHGKHRVNILQMFRVGRVNETTEFLSKLGNVRLLLHGSPVRNLIGILSRGLLLPKVVEDRGVHRTDIGNLGSGIYFSDSLSATIKYAHPGETEGTRFLLVCDVALGECIEFDQKDFSLTEAPEGYHSVHGVARTASLNTDFEDDEFVVYKTNQVKMKYIVKFCLPEDQIKSFRPPNNIELEQYRPPVFSDSSKIEDYQLPDTKAPSSTQAGLQDTSGNLIPLENVHVKGRIIDFVAQVVFFQTYTNQSHVPIEAKYIFPLDDKAAVCGFEAFINGKHIVGEIKEKEEAQREYREAISQGHGAYLMDQDAPDVFTVSVGNLPPAAKVLIKITYITELTLQGPVAVFFMPATVAPWQQDKALNENLQDTVEKICVKEIGTQQSFSLTMSIEMPYVIKFISSDTHELKQKSTDCKAVVSTVEGSTLESNGFSLHVGLCDPYLPRMWVEKHPEKESEACMLVFQPCLTATLPHVADRNEVIICLDCSNSMEGVTFTNARKIALHALSLLGKKQKVNIIQFGTGYKELFSYPKNITSQKVLTDFILSATPTMGNTDFWKTLRYLSLLYPAQGLRNILLISDGHLQNESLTLQLVKRSVHHTRLFTCGIGASANRHILRTLSQYGAGVFEYFNSNSKHSWKKQIEEQMARLHSPSCHSVSVKWQQLSLDAPEPLQAPAQVPSLFHNDRLLVYGFIPHCTQATLCALIEEKEFQAMVSTTELQKTTGTMIHKLTARALIRDYEDGILHENETNHEMKKQTLKSVIIKLSKENSLITQFTSFVAVEKRDGDGAPFPNIPNISTLIAEEDVDFLPYMSWEEKQPSPRAAQDLSSASPAEDAVQVEYSALFDVDDGLTLGACRYERPAFDECRSYLCTLEECEEMEMPLGLGHTIFATEEDSVTYFGEATPPPEVIANSFPLPADAGAAVSLTCPPPPRSPAPIRPPPPLPGGIPFSASLTFLTPSLSPAPISPPAPLREVIPSSAFPTFPPRPPSPAFMPLSPALPGAFSSFASCQTKLSLASNDQEMGSHPSQLPQVLTAGTSWDTLGAEFSALPAPQPGLSFSSVGVLCQKAPCLSPPRSSTTGPSIAYQSHDSTANVKLSSRSFFQRQPLRDTLGNAPARLKSAKVRLGSAVQFKRGALLSFEDSVEVDGSQQSDQLPSEMLMQPDSAVKDSNLPMAPYSAIKGSKRKTQPFKAAGGGQAVDSHRSWMGAVTCRKLFSLQTKDGFWKLTPELGVMLNVKVNALCGFLEQKGIGSLGVSGRENLLNLIATLLVLQFFCTMLEHEGIVVKSWRTLDASSTSRKLLWRYTEKIKKANEWVKRMEGQYSSICQRLELGKDWDSATKQLLGIEPGDPASPLHRALSQSQG